MDKVIVTDTTQVLDNNIIYKTFDDSNYVYVTASTTDPAILKPMLHQGVTVFFDIKGKKKKNVYVTYPFNEEKKPPKRDRSGQKEENQEMEEREKPDVTKILEDLSQKAMYSYFEEVKEFNTALNNLDIDVSFSTDSLEQIHYMLRIPKEKINTNSKKDLSKLSIGVLIGHNATDKESDGPSGGRSQMNIGNGQSRGSGGQGGPPGGGGQGRGGSGRSGGGASGGGERPSQENRQKNQEFWFDANLTME
ncbi:hypothetical protein GCM10022393_35830 [Aquimarina addita]|uniref:Uncharacterized protein n=1 Tax=Aquimarina addita TaxID=870485 RepID=A0ABP6UT93_9FLAO